MKFDTVIIGSGLAGLASGIRLAEAGKSCAIVSSGQSSLYFSSGSMDFLTRLPDGREVTHPLSALSELFRQAPNHPYSRIGEKNVVSLVYQAEKLIRESGLVMTGSASQNHYRVTPIGHQRMTWLSPARVPVRELERPFWWENVVVIGIAGFLDFHPGIVASALQRQGVKASAQEMHLPFLDKLRDNASEFRSVNIAHLLDRPENLPLIAEEISRLAQGHDAVFLPACIGLETDSIVEALQILVKKPIYLLPTLPPSLLGMRIYQALREQFRHLGGVMMVGDTVNGVEMADNHITGLYTRNHGDIPLRASHVILATGSFFSNGLKTTLDRVYEPLLDLDLLAYSAREQWTRKNVFAAQPYLKFGVTTDEYLRPLKSGQVVENLYAAGAVLGGYDPLAEGCGSGVSLLSALFVAEQIITGKRSTKQRIPEIA
ncbi:glycerol-3-phosphate dehydrogenase subunit GlpB [Xenorhabdus innexi]|uniref:Anaerobic glycerol-3-phosphate dehydrogenase subunit B n=1 Tax=Xenorhabdus innexi TaxID=290109 RepID=A0A1N6MQI9_9GAMM|nr:glycerol-3-phosphate dehydrogenase subunit GlpB [Xenorhabdus innexi]PHM33211.1 Anaerobic glycerol-3-phosphate dehydrogenase subunit B [Xenorhabdus innexi]SIP71107.1 Anaerobic glycerol-3-phosphate dehydrogenase subunit B [Xenorhabdus innexi]